MKLVTGLIRLFLILIDAILFFLFLLFFFWFFAKIKIPNQKNISNKNKHLDFAFKTQFVVCQQKTEYRISKTEFRIPNTVTAHTTTKYYNDNTATRHTPTPPTPHSCFVYQQTINNKQKHCIIYRNTRKKKKNHTQLQWQRWCSRQSGREGDAAARHRLAEGVAGCHQTTARWCHHLGGQSRQDQSQGDHARRSSQWEHRYHPRLGKCAPWPFPFRPHCNPYDCANDMMLMIFLRHVFSFRITIDLIWVFGYLVLSLQTDWLCHTKCAAFFIQAKNRISYYKSDGSECRNLKNRRDFKKCRGKIVNSLIIRI